MATGRMPVRVGGGFDWVDARDVAACAMGAADRGRPGAKYMASGHWCSLADVARMIAAATDRKAPVLKVPLSLARMCSPVAEGLCRAAGWTPLFTPYSVDALRHHRRVSHARASAELGYEPRPLQETIIDTCRWFADNGYLGTTTVHVVGAHE